MRKWIMIGVSVSMLVAGPAVAAPAASPAADDPLEAAYGNTVVVRSADGETTKLWLSKDGTYKGENPAGEPFTGTWSLKAKNTKFCWKSNEPPPKGKGKPARPSVGCAPLQADAKRKKGDKWRQKDFDDKQDVTVEIVPGN